MCVTTSEAKLSNTLIYTGHGTVKGQPVHVLAYQNIATNKSPGPNAMIIPFPTFKEMDENNIIDTRSFKNFLKDLTNASKMQTRMLGRSDSISKGGRISLGKVFDVGSYTVVLADNVDQIPEALERVSVDKRPEITEKFLEGYGRLYKDQPNCSLLLEWNYRSRTSSLVVCS